MSWAKTGYLHQTREETDIMSFLQTVRQVRAYLEDQGRISLRALKREFDLDDQSLEDLLEELVDIQQVAVREERALASMPLTYRLLPERGGVFGGNCSF